MVLTSLNYKLNLKKYNFNLQLKIEKIYHAANGASVTIILEDLTLRDKQSVNSVVTYLVKGFQFSFDDNSE